MPSTVAPVTYAGYVYGQPRTSVRVGVADTNYSISADDTLVGLTTLTAARVVTLPSAASAGRGKEIVVKDESGNCSASVYIRVAGIIDGATDYTISVAYGALRVYSNGSSWNKGGVL